MQRKHRIFTYLTVGIASLYIAGFFCLYPLIARYTVGVEPGYTIARTATFLHSAFYQPLLSYAGPKSRISKLWYKNSLYWCNRVHEREFCESSS
jgi:hypothetical protein